MTHKARIKRLEEPSKDAGPPLKRARPAVTSNDGEAQRIRPGAEIDPIDTRRTRDNQHKMPQSPHVAEAR
jgi:hypothetical protein